MNLAMRQLADDQLVTVVRRLLDENGLEPGQLQLELTERSVIGTDSEPLAVLGDLAAMGVRIAIDDFGTGYSNMTYLRRLPVCELKLAGSFINEVGPGGGNDAIDIQIVGSLVSLAHTLGMTVTAEEVETVAQADALPRVGLRHGAGKLLRPASTGGVVQVLMDSYLPHPSHR